MTLSTLMKSDGLEETKGRWKLIRRQFAHTYKLVRDIPGYKAGRTVYGHGDNQRFYFHQMRGDEESIYLDMKGASFTLDQVQEDGWFKPIGRLTDFIPPFPDPKRLPEFVDLIPDCRLVNDVDECRAINAMLADAGFQKRLYDFYRQEYNEFHGIKIGV
jgi:hypothetical protein